jgi:hypothetical protein
LYQVLVPDQPAPADHLPPRLIAPPDREVPRYLPERSLPPHRYVPGIHPRPFELAPVRRAERGSDGRRPPGRPGEASLDDWLWGVDLFNAFYFWEAHEAWEGPWRRWTRESPAALLLQGLIQVSAALLKVHLEAPAPAARLATAGLGKLDRAARDRPILFGLPLGQVESSFRTYFRPLDERTLPPLDASVPALILVGAPLA